jgi:hypothetical protein
LNRSTIRWVIALSVVVMVLALGAVIGATPARAAWGEPNGCGPGGWINDVLGATPYNDQFAPACNLHDWCYGGAAKPVDVGAVGDWLSRKRCDDLFLKRMLATCGSDSACQAWAGQYYDAVRTFGDSILFQHPYTTEQREGQHNLLPNPSASKCSGCTPGDLTPTVHVRALGSNTTYWKLDSSAWHRIECPAWDPNHTACTTDVLLYLTAGGHAFRVKTIDYYTGTIGKTSIVAAWTT